MTRSRAQGARRPRSARTAWLACLSVLAFAFSCGGRKGGESGTSAGRAGSAGASGTASGGSATGGTAPIGGPHGGGVTVDGGESHDAGSAGSPSASSGGTSSDGGTNGTSLGGSAGTAGDAEPGEGGGGSSGTDAGASAGTNAGGAAGSNAGPECGDGVREEGEACDLGALNGTYFGDGTGCSRGCAAEPICRSETGNHACSGTCGDGNIDAPETCDDGNRRNRDGCSASCTVEPGATCQERSVADLQPCSSNAAQRCFSLPIVYRDFDGQQAPSGHPDFLFMGATVDGVKTTCVPNASGANRLANMPTNGSCPASDATDPCRGLVNASLGPDGKPTLETGKGGSCACTFTDWGGTGVLMGAANVKTCNAGAANPAYIANVPVKVIHSASSFAEWYSDSALSTKVSGTLEFAQIGGTSDYVFSVNDGRTVSDDLHDLWLASRWLPTRPGAATSLSSGFFPLETTTRAKLCNLWPYWLAHGVAGGCVAKTGNPIVEQWDPYGWSSAGSAPQPDETLGIGFRPVLGMMRNFYFTSELRYLMRYRGDEHITFVGDDDAWIFINGVLVLDLGATHERMKGTVTLNRSGEASWTVAVYHPSTGAEQPLPGAIGAGSVAGLGLELGKTYEVAIFHADRTPRESNYQLSITAPARVRSVCHVP